MVQVVENSPTFTGVAPLNVAVRAASLSEWGCEMFLVVGCFGTWHMFNFEP